MSPPLWKIIVVFVGAFIGMVAPVAVLLVSIALGPPPYVLHEEELGPAWSTPRLYPDGSTVAVHTYPNAAAAKDGVETLARLIPRTLTTTIQDVVRYTRQDNQRRGLLLPVDNRVINIEAADDTTIDQRFKRLPFVSENPEQNVMSRLISQHLGVFSLGLGLYLLLWFYFLVRGGTWATRIPPPPGIPPVPVETLRARLLAINDLNLPFQIREEPTGRLVAEWRIADAHWMGILEAGGLRKAHWIYMELDARAHKVRAQDRERTISWSGGTPRVGWSLSFFRGINFWQYERGAAVGLFFKEGTWTTRAYTYRFSLTEMKNPLIEVIVQSGWTFAPVITFFRPVGG